MAKSKIVQANRVVAGHVTSGFQKLTDAVVGSYTKIEDLFVDRYLTRDGETVEQAKKRIREET